MQLEEGKQELTRFGRVVGIEDKDLFFFVPRLLRQLGFGWVCPGYLREREQRLPFCSSFRCG